jgi:required for meiotic nuclear division protein 1
MRIPLKAWYFRSTIDLKKVREKFPEFTVLHRDPLILEIGKDSWVLVTKFGGVVFWPFDEETAKKISQRIQETLEDPFLVKEVEDRLVVETEKGQQKVLFNEVWLASTPTVDQIRIVTMLLAQSVALEYLEIEVDSALRRFVPYLRALQEKGRANISSRKILQHIGFAGQTRYAVLANLTLFDKPDVTWESESIEQLYLQIYDLFDLPERQEATDRKLAFLADNTSHMYELLSTRKLLWLEWAVVILIAAEILAFALYEMLK